MERVDLQEGESLLHHLKKHKEIYGHIVTQTGVHIREYKYELMSPIAVMFDYVDPVSFTLISQPCLKYRRSSRRMDCADWDTEVIHIPEKDLNNNQKLSYAYDKAMGIL